MQGFLPVFQGHFEASTHLNYAAKHGSPFHQLPNAKLAPNTVNGSANSCLSALDFQTSHTATWAMQVLIRAATWRCSNMTVQQLKSVACIRYAECTIQRLQHTHAQLKFDQCGAVLPLLDTIPIVQFLKGST